jgi:hypothetical protein
MFGGDLKPFEIRADHLLVEESDKRAADVQFLSTDLDRNVPRRRDADKFAIRRVAVQAQSGRAKLGIVVFFSHGPR